MYEDARKCANGFRVTYPALPTVPARNDDPLDGLQDVMDWCIKSSEVVDDIVSNLERQTIIAVISQLKKLRDFPRRVLSLVNSKLREQAQKEARAKVEKEYKNLNDKVSRLKLEKMLLIDQEKIIGELQLEEQEILRRETKEIVQTYFSKDPTFKDRLSQLNSEINEMLETLNKLVGSNTPTGKLLDIYCKLKDIPLQQQFDDVGYAYCPIDDFTDVICSGCNRLYTSVDNVIKTFEEIQMKAEQQIDETPPQTDLAKNGALERIKKEVDKTDQERLQEIIEVLKNWQKSKKTDKDFEAAKSALPPIAKTYDILCRSRGQCGAKTTDFIRWLGSAAKDGTGYYPALLDKFASPEVIADLEKWQEKLAETEQGTKREREGICKWYQTNTFKFVVVPLVVALFLGIPSWLSLSNKRDHSEVKTSGDSSTAIVTSGPNSPGTESYSPNESEKIQQFIETQNLLLEQMMGNIYLNDHNKYIQEYTLGYALFGINSTNEIITLHKNTLEKEKEWEFIWYNAKITTLNAKNIFFRPPSIRSSDGNIFLGTTDATISRENPGDMLLFDGQIVGINVFGRVLVDNSTGIICVIGIKEYK
jgi:hypothetical protein